MSAKNVIFRKQIQGVVYDLLPKTLLENVVDNMDGGQTLKQIIDVINANVGKKVDESKFTELQTKFNNLVNDAPEAYDTLVEISTYITSHKNEYDALLAISNNKVDKVEGKQLSTEDFTTELKTKLTALYDKAALDKKFSDMDTKVNKNTGDIATLNGADSVVGSVDNKIKTAKTAIDASIKKNTDAINVLKGGAEQVGSVANAVGALKKELDPKIKKNADDITEINDPATGILKKAKDYADQQVGGTAKIYAQTTKPDNLTENDLWIFYQDPAG